MCTCPKDPTARLVYSGNLCYIIEHCPLDGTMYIKDDDDDDDVLMGLFGLSLEAYIHFHIIVLNALCVSEILFYYCLVVYNYCAQFIYDV